MSESVPGVGTARHPLRMGRQVQLGLASLLVLLALCMLTAISLVLGLRAGESRLGHRDVPFTNAVSAAALSAKGIANDQRGFLLSGDRMYIDEAEHRIADAQAAFSSAASLATDPAREAAVNEARAGFERWVTALRDEFATFASGDRQSAIGASLGPDRQLRKAYERAIANALALGHRSIESADKSTSAALSRSVWILAAMLVAALVIGAGVAIWLVRTIANPLFKLVALLAPDMPWLRRSPTTKGRLAERPELIGYVDVVVVGRRSRQRSIMSTDAGDLE